MTPSVTQYRLPLVIMLTVVLVGLECRPASAQVVDFDSGLVGIVTEQRARLNVVDVADVGDRVDPASTCPVHLTLFNAAGTIIAAADMEVGPTHPASLEHQPERRPLRTGGEERLLIRARVTKMAACADSQLASTFEVLDRDGKTQVLYSAAGGGRTGPVLATIATLRAGEWFGCFVVNVSSSKTVKIDAEMVNQDGISVQKSTLTVSPRAIGGSLLDPGTNNDYFLYCRFVLHTGTKDDVRASSCMLAPDPQYSCGVVADAR